ncbi:DUF6572 domain-containing protein [Cellulomonas composti]|uniref:DUF6572 domain-containing protein n=1 Tax=Cellulomonas composti TaxID=266130 RepID=UPI0011BF3BEB|nr:DUF6572 domain-containing protein [Cellulomonas composti]
MIDLVTYDAATGEYALIMIEERPWTDSPEQLAQLSEKINNYAMFALDEGLLRAYPQSAGHPVRIQLDCTGVPTPRAQEYLDLTTGRLGDYRIRFVVNLLG